VLADMVMCGCVEQALGGAMSRYVGHPVYILDDLEK